MARGVVFLVCLAFIAGLAFLTVRVVLTSGITVVVVLAFIVLALLSLGILGALTGRER